MRNDTRGQAYTLEGVISAIVIASALVIGLQAVDPAPWTEDDPFDTEEYRDQVGDLLAAANDGADPSRTDELSRALLCVNSEDTSEFDSRAFGPESSIGERFEDVIDREYRITAEYVNEGGETVEQIERSSTDGTPTGTSITVTRQHTVYETNDVFVYNEELGMCEQETDTIPEFKQELQFPVDDQHEDDELYAIVNVRVVIW